MTYRDYLKSPEWKRLADEAKERAGWRCQLCNKSGNRSSLHAHHRCYDRKGKAGELQDVVCLCARCHALTHNRTIARDALPQAIQSVYDFLTSSENTPPYKWPNLNAYPNEQYKENFVDWGDIVISVIRSSADSLGIDIE